MINFTLERQNHLKPDMKKLYEMRDNLELLISSDFESAALDWREIVELIVPFQYEDGSFNLLDSYRIESDCRVYYCHESTYICTALLMKALLVDEHIISGREYDILPKAMHMCCARKLCGHGYGGLKGQSKALSYFIKCDVKAFLEKYPDICPEFSLMMQNIEQVYASRVAEADFKGDWNENYESSIREIHNYFGGNYIFVYGTLMKGQANHDAFLSEEYYLSDGSIKGYEMFDLGYYPGIKKGYGHVPGEVYRITDSMLKDIDRLEGEGYLYTRVPVRVRTDAGMDLEAFVYVFNGSTEGCTKISGRYNS